MNRSNHSGLFSNFLTIFTVFAAVVIITSSLFWPLGGVGKWIPYLAILIPAGLFSLGIFKNKFIENRFIGIISSLVFLAVLVLGIINFESSLIGISTVLLIFCCFAVIPKLKFLSIIFAATSFFLLRLDSAVFINTLHGPGFVWTLCVMLSGIFVFLYLIKQKEDSGFPVIINKLFFAILAIISFFLSFRSDQISGAAYNWEFFTGPIQTIRSGGELLWSAPSQYGFLNVLLPSFLPWTSRYSFYIFEATLFFICILMILHLVFIYSKRSIAFVLVGLIGISLFLFSHPSLRGPAPFPSSSSIRFFPVYLLLYAIFLVFKKNDILQVRVNWKILFPYFVGFLWSTETFLYCSIIFSVYLICLSIVSSLKIKSFSYRKFLGRHLLIILAAFIIFNLFYHVITKHFPDWSMYSMYASGYSAGFGEVLIPPWGIYWALIIVFSAVTLISWKLLFQKKYKEWIMILTCFSALWILSSYYVGRAVVDNFTAILPLIFYIFIIMLISLRESNFFNYRILLSSVFLPWIVIGIIGGIGNPQFAKEAQGFRFFENLDKQVRQEKELNDILKSLGATNGKRFGLYDDPSIDYPVYLDGKGNYKDYSAGFPLPFNVLAVPISPEKRSIIVERFLDKINQPVYFIYNQVLNENGSIDMVTLSRIIEWREFLNNTYQIQQMDYGKYGVTVVNKE